MPFMKIRLLPLPHRSNTPKIPCSAYSVSVVGSPKSRGWIRVNKQSYTIIDIVVSRKVMSHKKMLIPHCLIVVIHFWLHILCNFSVLLGRCIPLCVLPLPRHAGVQTWREGASRWSQARYITYLIAKCNRRSGIIFF